MRCILLRRFCTAALAGIVVLSVARASLAEDPVPLPPGVSMALHQTVEAQCSGMMWYGQAAVFNRIPQMRARTSKAADSMERFTRSTRQVPPHYALKRTGWRAKSGWIKPGGVRTADPARLLFVRQIYFRLNSNG